MHSPPASEDDASRDDPPTSITELLARSRSGDPDATAQLVDRVYDELVALARGLCSPGPEASMSATALVHEAFVRMHGAAQDGFGTRRQFYAFAAKVMRNVLVDHARRRNAQKRGGAIEVLPLDEALDVVGAGRFDWLELDEALDALADRDARLARVVELRVFGGLSSEEVAAELEISTTVARREWRLAKAWLQRELSRGDTTR